MNMARNTLMYRLVSIFIQGITLGACVTLLVSTSTAQTPTPTPLMKVYWADINSDEINRADVDGMNIEPVINSTDLRQARDIEIDYSAMKIYWTENGGNGSFKKIMRADVTPLNSNIETIVTAAAAGLVNPRSIALDVLNGKVYWGDDGTSKIQRANLDGTNIQDVVTGTSTPRGLAVFGSKVYWTERDTPMIRRADLDGSNIENLVDINDGIVNPNGLDIDVIGGKMYWTDLAQDRIQRANLDGSNIENLVTTGLTNPLGIAIDPVAQKMYWTDEGSNPEEIKVANLDGTNVQQVLVTGGFSFPVGIDLLVPPPPPTATPTATPSFTATATPTFTPTPTPTAMLDPYLGYKIRGSKIPNNKFPKGWVITLDDAILDNSALDDPENYEIRKEKFLLNPATVSGEPTPETPDLHYLNYQLRKGKESVAPPKSNGRFPRTHKHIKRHWNLSNGLGSITLQTRKVRSLLLPSGKDLVGPPSPVANTTHFECYQAKVPRDGLSDQAPESKPGSGKAKFRKDMQTFASDQFDDCALNRDGFPSFQGTAVEGMCLVDLKKPVEICSPATKSAVVPPRKTNAVITGALPSTDDVLLCYQIRLASKFRDAAAAALVGKSVGDRVSPKQNRHLKRKLRAGNQVYTLPSNQFPSPTQVDTSKQDLLCLRTSVLSVAPSP